MLKFIKFLIVIGLIVSIILSGVFYWRISSPLELKSEQLDFNIAPGSSMRAAAREIAASGVMLEPWIFIFLGKVLRVESSIKAGSYEIARGITSLELMSKLTRGDVTQTEIVFIEGWSFRQMRERLDTHPDIRHDTKALSDREIMHLIGVVQGTAEGQFFPDTYLFAKQSSDVAVLTRAYRAMQRHLSREWTARASGLPLWQPV